MPQTLTEDLADFVTKTEFKDLPEDAVRWAKINGFLDHVGVILSGSRIDSSRIMIDYVLGLGGREESTIIGTKKKTSCPYAALANGTSGHALELDDAHGEAKLHPGVVNVPASLAVAEWRQADGKVFLTALILGYEIHCRIGLALLGISVNEGFHSTGTCGVFAAAGAAGKILGLNRDQLVNAFGIAGSFASGLMEYVQDGTLTKRMHPGRAAEGGIMAAILAQKGYTGPATILEGKSGFLNAFSYEHKYDPKKVVDDLGKEWSFLRTSTKLYASCKGTHTLIEPTIILAQKYGIKPEDVESIQVKSGRSAMGMFAEDPLLAGNKQLKYEPQTVVDAQFSGPFCIATALSRHRAIHTGFTEETIKDPEIIRLAAKVRGTFEPEPDEPYRTDITIRLTDGTEYSQCVDYPKGGPENPATEQDIVMKLKTLSQDIPIGEERLDRIIKMAHNLEKAENISEETTLFMC